MIMAAVEWQVALPVVSGNVVDVEGQLGSGMLLVAGSWHPPVTHFLSQAVLLAERLCPSPSLATLPRRQSDCALPPAMRNSLLRFKSMTLLSCSIHFVPLAKPLALSFQSANISSREWRYLLLS